MQMCGWKASGENHRHGEERSHLYTCKSTSGGLRGHVKPHAIPSHPTPAVMARNSLSRFLRESHLYTCKSISGGLRGACNAAFRSTQKPTVMARNEAISTPANQHPAGNGGI